MTSNNTKKRMKISLLQTSLFSVIAASVLLLSACGSGGGKVGSSNNNVNPSDNTAIESIVVVSPTESGVINAVAGYSQKILVAGIDKNGTRKLLTQKDDLKYTLNSESYAKFNESAGTIVGTKSGSGILTLNLKKGNLTTKVPFTVESAVLESITVSANESDASYIVLPKGYNVNLSAKGTFINGGVTTVRDISTYTGLWSSGNPKVAFESDTIFGATLFAVDLGKNVSITAKKDVLESSISVTVVNAALTKLTVTPDSIIIPFKSKQAMKAVATFDDNVKPFDLNVTNNVVWSIESTQIANIDNTTGILSTESAGKAESLYAVVVKAITPTKVSATAKLTVGNPIITAVFIGDENSTSIESAIASLTMAQGDIKKIYPYSVDSNGKVYHVSITSSSDCQWDYVPNGIISLDTKYLTYAILKATGISGASSSVNLICQNGKLSYSTGVYIK